MTAHFMATVMLAALILCFCGGTVCSIRDEK
jgi:hypothetical protein